MSSFARGRPTTNEHRRAPTSAGGRALAASPVAATLALLVLASACTETGNLGSSEPDGPLPVDGTSPIVLLNDGWSDNWQGEYAVLLANYGGPKLAGIIVNEGGVWQDINANVDGWRSLVAAARMSGMTNLPDPIASIGDPLSRPSNGDIDSTTPNRSEGARFLVDVSTRLSLPYRPVVVVTGGRLTDVADAYLLDRTLPNRVVVVSSLGTTSASGAAMGVPNGEMDVWADTIVTARFRYVQVSAFYDQQMDVPSTRVGDLPQNAFGTWVANKQSKVWSITQAADQIAVQAVAIPGFAVADGVKRVASTGHVAADATTGPDLVTRPNGPSWLVTQSASALAINRFWQAIRDPSTYRP